MTRRVLSLILACLLAFGVTACAAPVSSQSTQVHKIGVAVYDLADEQVAAFREYLEGYIGSNFEDVQFLYSSSIHNPAEQTAFMKQCIAEGAEGIMAFNSYDLASEVHLCADNQVYYMKPSSTVSDADYEAVADNPYYLGSFGPGADMEYQAGFDMGMFFADKSGDGSYFILSGGAPLGNGMHLERTAGILDALQQAYGVQFADSSRELAAAPDVVAASAGNLTVRICGGYISSEPFLSAAKQAYEAGPSEVVLSVVPIAGLADTVQGAQLGVIDCFSGHNAQLFAENRMQYLCGKFSSIIGPAFAMMYNAVKGDADAFRDNGRAVRITQGFWVAENREEFEQMYALSCGIALNAYSFEDILQVIRSSNPDADFAQLRKLAEKCEFSDAQARRK